VQQTDLAGKHLELLHDLIPGLRRLAIIVNTDNSASILEMHEVQAAARAIGLEAATLEIRRAEDIALALEELKGRAEARSCSPTGSASAPWRLARTFRRWSVTGSSWKRAV